MENGFDFSFLIYSMEIELLVFSLYDEFILSKKTKEREGIMFPFKYPMACWRELIQAFDSRS